MKKLKENEVAEICWGRPRLKSWLKEKQVTDIALLTNAPTGPEEDRWGRKNLLLLAKGKNHTYLVMDKAGTKSKPDDTLLTWLSDELPIGESTPEASSEYVVIERSKLGRPRRELTATERDEIIARHDLHQGINKIAKEMHLSTKRVSSVIKQGGSFLLRGEVQKGI